MPIRLRAGIKHKGFDAQADSVGIGSGNANHVTVYNYSKAATQRLSQRDECTSRYGDGIARGYQAAGAISRGGNNTALHDLGRLGNIDRKF